MVKRVAGTPAVKAAASWVNKTVIQPAATALKAVPWVNAVVTRPASVPNAVTAFIRTGRTVAAATAVAARAVQEQAVRAYRSTTAYVQARTAEIKAKVIEFACTTANKLSDAWQATTTALAQVPWDKVGKVALIAGGAVIGVAATIATAGAAGPLVAGVMIAATTASTAMAANDLGTELTGHNFLRDDVLGGNQGAYDAINGAVTMAGFVGPAGFTRAATSSIDHAAGLVDDALRLGNKAEDVASFGATANTARRNVDDIAETLGNVCVRPNSFAAGTLVLMADGSHKPIEDVQVGDKVIASDPVTGEQGPRTVIDLIRHGGLHTMVDIEFSDGAQIDATSGHPFWVTATRQWVQAADLQPGDTVTTATGTMLTVTDVTISHADQTAYNLTIADLHTYHVSNSNILVHNTGPNNCTSTAANTAARLSPGGIRFSQNSVNGAAEIEASMRANGWVGDAIDVVRMRDGGLTSVDNTRLLAAKRAGIDVRANVHGFDGLIPEEMAGRFLSRKGDVPTTWGDAVLNRISSQSAGYRNQYPSGSPLIGWTGN